MARTRSLPVVLILLGLTASTAAPAAESPSGAPSTSLRKCVDMDGREFYWSWSNVPFASTCSSEASEEAHPSVDACRAGCSDRLGACFPSTTDKHEIDACFDRLESCQASCTGK
ncbi:hypothetical protein JQ615_12135 [Bradyrhizobium jicamae]|uniref:Uncharacterized protein n=1 Tax=Bradyrhizobium jicamae TaxID=280332 RepID=A0ABS5FH79_9BRAD|nr:hypothetical protein [Bradyrhizobium jicamae]MBR0796138.1 hypothetical protein [Bradyrhizobium jicamae]MBR0937688.1 hypothetical protein [Bradyrhizobium jicamae]